MRIAKVLVVVVVLLGGACRGGSDDTASRSASTSSSSTTVSLDVPTISTSPSSPTPTTAVRVTTTTRAGTGPAAATTTTGRTQVRGVAVDNAPRDPYVDRSDNNGSFVYAANSPKPPAQSARAENDPLSFSIACSVANDGHGSCHMELTNNVSRNAQFPGGLKVTVTLRHDDGSTTETEMPTPQVTSLRPGEKAIVDGTIDVFEPGGYTYFATTTVHWP